MQITEVVAMCRRMVDWVLRIFRTRDQEATLTLRRSFVLDSLVYCSRLWSTHSVRWIAELEAVQQCSTKTIASINGLSYWERRKNRYSPHSSEDGTDTQ